MKNLILKFKKFYKRFIAPLISSILKDIRAVHSSLPIYTVFMTFNILAIIYMIFYVQS